jgi:hypothetical protein
MMYPWKKKFLQHIYSITTIEELQTYIMLTREEKVSSIFKKLVAEGTPSVQFNTPSSYICKQWMIIIMLREMVLSIQR